jgi:hypothetical protein
MFGLERLYSVQQTDSHVTRYDIAANNQNIRGFGSLDAVKLRIVANQLHQAAAYLDYQ